jgi:hypothetical protein
VLPIRIVTNNKNNSAKHTHLNDESARETADGGGTPSPEISGTRRSAFFLTQFGKQKHCSKHATYPKKIGFNQSYCFKVLMC